MKLTLIVVSVLTMIGCSVSKEPPSPIVQKAEACGASPLAETSTVAVQEWFGKHRDCAVAVDAMCKPVREKVAALGSSAILFVLGTISEDPVLVFLAEEQSALLGVVF